MDSFLIDPVSGSSINPATEETLGSVNVSLNAIESDSENTRIAVQNINSSIDVNLSTVATETTLGSVNNITEQMTFSGSNLNVTSQVSPIPPLNVIWREQFFLDGSDADMDVNGASGIDDFYFNPLTGIEEYVTELKLYLKDDGTWNINEFANIGHSLTNGVQIQVNSNSTLYEIVNLQDNLDVVLTFSDSRFISTEGLFGEDDYYIGSLKFPTPLYLNESDGDYIRIRIRDDIRNVSVFRVKALAFRSVT